MARLPSLKGPGRAKRLRIFQLVLLSATLIVIILQAYGLTVMYDNSGSWGGLWEEGWRHGHVVTDLLVRGTFQVFILGLGWSFWLRLRNAELAGLRLRRSESKYRSIINHAGEAIFLLDERGTVQEWNKMSERLFGVPRRNALGRSVEELDLGLRRDREITIEQVFDDVRRTGRRLTYEVNLENGGGNGAGGRHLSLTVSAIRPDSAPADQDAGSFVVIARDITEAKQLESRMSETEKLAGIGQLAAGIAHQLNTPLGSILLSAQMLGDDIDDENMADDIQRIIRQTEQCRGIIKGLLNFARPSASGRSAVDVEESIRDTRFLMEKNLRVAGVEVSIASRTGTWVFGNRNELDQVFFNLMANALDAMPGGGTITVEIDEGDPGELVVMFRDTGEGIPTANHESVFLPFFTTKDYGKGTGLGLSIVARIMHEHGGRIELKSTPGEGTCFRMSFPRARRPVGTTALIDDSQET
jgi:PAS domain S-box-containing protein